MESSRLHPFFRLFLCALGLIGVTVAFQGLGVLVILVAEVTRHSPFDLNEFIARILRNALPLTVISYPPSILFIVYCRNTLDRASFASLGLRPIRIAPNVVGGAIAGVATFGLLWALLLLTGAIVLKGWSPELLQNGARSLFPLTAFFMAFVGTALFEEILFRGYICHNLRGWFGWRWGIGLQALLFASVHLLNVVNGTPEDVKAALYGQPNIFLVGVLFALTARKTGSLWYAIAFHALWNFSSGCLFSLPVSGIKVFRLLDVQSVPNTGLSGGSFGAEGSLLLIPILLGLIGFISLAPDHPQTVLDLKLSGEATAPEAASVVLEDEEEESRENRYRARFGSAEGFDADTLRELRVLQQQRDLVAAQEAHAEAQVAEEARKLLYAQMEADEEAAETREAAESPTPLEPVLASEIRTESPVTPPPTSDAPPSPVVPAPPPTLTKPTTTAPTTPAPTPAAPPVPALTTTALPKPSVATPPTPSSPAEPAPPTPAPPKPVKKSGPRW